MGNTLDLLLITDEPQAWDGDYWKRNHEKDRLKMLALSITAEEREKAINEFGVSNYLVPLVGEDGLFQVRLPHRPHLGVCDIATVATEAGFSVRVLDNVLRFPERTEQMKTLLSSNPKAVGLSTTFILTPELVKKYVQKIRDLAPESKIILGGPTVRRCVETHSLGDFAVFGDGEDAIVPLLEAIDGKRLPRDIPFTCFKEADGTVCYNDSAQKAARLGIDGKAYKARDTTIPLADWRLLDRSLLNVFPIEFSRGCKYSCAYCSYDRGKYVRCIDSIREELIDNARLGITMYRLSDANFTDGPSSNPRFAHEVCQLMIDLDLGLKWSCYGRADNITEELIDLMKRAGCFAICFGIESGDDDILKKMYKSHDVEDSYRAIRICKQHGIYVHGSFVVGYPGETKETFEHTLEFIENSRPDTISMGQFRLVRNSLIWQLRDKYGLEGDAMVWRHDTMDSNEADSILIYGMTRLINNGIVMGHEFGFPVYMGLGISIQDSYQMMKDMHTIVKEAEYQDQSDFQAARMRLKDKFLNVFPRAIAAEQRCWKIFGGSCQKVLRS